MENLKAIILGIVSGIILLLSGGTGGIPIWIWVPVLLGTIIIPELTFLAVILLIVLDAIALAGGFSVLVGALLIWRSHIVWGKFLILVGSGFGLFSLILATSGLYLNYWLGFIVPLTVIGVLELFGLICAVLAQFSVEKPPKPTK